VLRTVCLKAGNMTRIAAHQLIREAATRERRKICSVCWSDEGQGEECVLECVDCGLLAHSNCCYDRGEILRNGNRIRHWRCAVCSHFTGAKPKPRRTSKMPSRFDDCETIESFQYTSNNVSSKEQNNTPCPSCSLCPHRGGAMSQMNSELDPGKWAHEVCRVWSVAATDKDSKMDVIPERLSLHTVCALCGTGGAGLTRCAARGCFVAFHPMCAVIASKMSVTEANQTVKKRSRMSRQNSELNEEDIKLCHEYTLQLVHLSMSESVGDNANEENTTSKVVPIAFCGLHNPRRDASFFGCLPGGRIKD